MTSQDTSLAERMAALSPEQRSTLLATLRRNSTSAPQEGREVIERRPKVHPDLQPVTFEQQRLWFLDRFDPGGSAHNVPLVLDLEGELDLERLQQALDGLVERHEALRTTFVDADQPRQLVSRPSPVALHVTDLSDQPVEEARLMAREVLDADAHAAFDLVVGPLLRATLIRLSPRRCLLQLTLHHIVCDGWSVQVLANDLTDLYAGRSPEPSQVPVQYADYACWQRDHFTGDRLDDVVQLWKGQLAGVPALDLPTDRPRPPVRRSRGAWAHERLPAELWSAVKASAATLGATPFTLVLAALELTLGRLTGQQDFAVGTVLAGRDRPELEPMVGYVARTVALRSDLPHADRSFRSLVGRVSERMLFVQEHAQLPFERLIEALDLPRDPSRTPIFSVFLALQNLPASRLALPGLTIRLQDRDTRAAQFDLSLYLTEDAHGVDVGIEFDTDLFDEATARRLVGHVRTALSAVVREPDVNIDDVTLLDHQDVRRQSEDWNRTSAPQSEITLVEMLDELARQDPDAPAVAVGSDAPMTRSQLRDRSTRIAQWLVARGVGPGAWVGVGLSRRPDLVASLLAVLRCGAGYVPLDPSYPPVRVSQMIEDSEMVALITDSASVGRLPAPGQEVLCLDRDALPERSGEVEAKGTVDAPAYCIFTSGSTGRPKGVVVSQRSLLNLLESVNSRVGLDAGTRLLAVTSLSFDIAGLELWSPLITGGTVHLCDEATAGDGPGLARLISSVAPTVMQATPATWRLLADSGWEGAELEALCGGEALPEDLAERVRPLVSRLWNMYGPTETTIWSAVQPVGGTEVTIGGPVANTRLYVTDSRGRLAPLGSAGELLIGGHGLAHGYLDRPALTAERFVPDRWSPEPGARAYRTGDLVRQRPGGAMRFVARLDNQVKVRGYRIELGDIEAALASAPGVAQVVVIVSSPPDPQLVAYVRALPGEEPTVADLRSHVGERLPAYMVPGRFALVHDFPLTPNGKIDRAHLPDPGRHAMSTGAEFEEPGTHAERVLAEVWGRLLNHDVVGRQDNFFALGGDSLIAVRMVSHAGQEGVQLTTQQVFQHQTLAELAAAAGTIQLVANQGEVTGELDLPIATHQFHEGVNPQSQYHSIVFQFATRERLDPAILEEVLRELVAHHDSLRTRALVDDQGRWERLVIDPVSEPDLLLVVDASDVPVAGRDDFATEWTNRAETEFRPESGGLFRAVLIDFGQDGGQRLLLAGHYLVADVVSWHILTADFDVLYRRRAAGEPYRLPAKTTSMPEWIGRLAERAVEGEATAESALWTDPQRQVAHPIPIDHPGGENRIRANQAAFLVLPVEETTELLSRAVTGARLSLDAILLTAIGQAVCPGPILAVDIYVPGRDSPYPDMDLSRTVGWLTYRYPMWLDLGRGAAPLDSVRAVQRQLSSVPRGGLGAGQLRYYGGDPAVARALAEQPKPDVLFNFFGAAPGGFQVLQPMAGTSGHYHDTESQRMRALMINGAVFRGQLRLEWEYSSGLHEESTIESFIDRAIENLRTITDAAQPGTPSSDDKDPS